jgi:hypothetical protein
MDALPDGAFVLHEGTPALVSADRLHPFGRGLHSSLHARGVGRLRS